MQKDVICSIKSKKILTMYIDAVILCSRSSNSQINNYHIHREQSFAILMICVEEPQQAMDIELVVSLQYS